MMQSAIFEDVQVDSNSNAMASLASALASAAASERDNRQRKMLVESMVRTLFDTLGSSKNSLSTNQESNQLMQQILEEEEGGTTTIPYSFSNITPSTKITLNQNNPLKLHWSWQTTKNADGATDSTTCYISLFAKEGVTIEFFPPPITSTASTTRAEDESLTIAICEISNFQWTLEGTIKKQNDQSIQTFWKLPTASFSWVSGHLGDIPAEEILLEAKEISLTGSIANRIAEGGALQLQPKSILDIKLSSVESLGLSDKEIRRVGMALRAFVNFLDRIISVPELHLSLTDISKTGEQDTQESGNQQQEGVPSFDKEEGGEKSLGGAMKYYLKYYCNGNNQKRSTNILQPAKLFSKVDFASLKDSVAQLAESKEKYAAAAVEAAGAAAIAGKKIADRGGALVGSFWTSVNQARSQEKTQEQEPDESTTTATNAEGTSMGGFSFGNSFRNAVARGKEATDRVVARGVIVSGGEDQPSADSTAETNTSVRSVSFGFGNSFLKAVEQGKEATGRIVSQQSEGSRFGGGFPKGMFASMHVGNYESTPQTEPEQIQEQQQQQTQL